MLNLDFALPSSHSLIEGTHMDKKTDKIDKININSDVSMLVGLFYYLELKSLLQRLFYEKATRGN
jgi:hypothetical protein